VDRIDAFSFVQLMVVITHKIDQAKKNKSWQFQGCGQLVILRSLGLVFAVLILCFWIVVTVTAQGVD